MLELRAAVAPHHQPILTIEALAFIEALASRFAARRDELLAKRAARQKRFDAGEKPDFISDTKHIREGDWKIAPIPAELLDRRVEITGPVDRKMVINALNSGAHVFMADFEDAHAPTWEGTLDGQLNMRDAVRRTIDYVSPEGKHYKLVDKPAILFVRPRGWHLDEKHVLLSGKPIPGALFDFGLFLFHNAREQLARGTAPYFYLPKLESHLEARLWADIFRFSEEALGIPHGSIRATVLIETITATFELHEILYELRDWIVALNCGRWDYIFSYLKKLRAHPEILLPDRAQVTMTQPFLRAYSRLVIKTCHQRGAMAMGGMAAQIPIKNDPAANDAALAKVRADKEREAGDGHDGTWVAHPALVPIAMEIFDRLMPTPNQLHRTLDDFSTSQQELLTPPNGSITEAGFRNNISVSLRYLASWLSGQGCVPIFNLMEDAATAEISRTQLWQWVHHPKAMLDDGRKIDSALYQAMLAEEMEKIKREQGANYPSAQFEAAKSLLSDIVLASELQDFLTLPAYERLVNTERNAA